MIWYKKIKILALASLTSASLALVVAGCAGGSTYYLKDGRRVIAHPTDGEANKTIRIPLFHWNAHIIYEWQGQAYWCVHNCTSNESPIRDIQWPIPKRPAHTPSHNLGPPRAINRPSLERVLPCLPDQWCGQ